LPALGVRIFGQSSDSCVSFHTQITPIRAGSKFVFIRPLLSVAVGSAVCPNGTQELPGRVGHVLPAEAEFRRGPGDAPRDGSAAMPGERGYLLAGLLACGTWGLRMEPAWSTGKPPTGAATATPAPPLPIQDGRRTPTSARTARLPATGCPCCWSWCRSSPGCRSIRAAGNGGQETHRPFGRIKSSDHHAWMRSRSTSVP
jgi:hypothetical protein